jgi:hypothetical protein
MRDIMIEMWMLEYVRCARCGCVQEENRLLAVRKGEAGDVEMWMFGDTYTYHGQRRRPSASLGLHHLVAPVLDALRQAGNVRIREVGLRNLGQ